MLGIDVIFRTVQGPFTVHQKNVPDDELHGCSSNDRLDNYLISFLRTLQNLLIVVESFLIYFSEQ